MDVLFCTDAAVGAVHADLSLLSPADLGWRATVATLSDLAAMGGEPWCLVVSTSAPSEVPIDELMEGVIEAAVRFGCPVVGGDVTSSATASVVVAALGLVPSGSALPRGGARVGDQLYLTGELGGSAAGLRSLRAESERPEEAALRERHRRPEPRLEAGWAARELGATAAIDLSDGLGRDLHRLADASGVGFQVEHVPVARGATIDEALGGGEDYELLLAVPSGTALSEGFAARGLRAPFEIGVILEDPAVRVCDGQPLEPLGYQHET